MHELSISDNDQYVFYDNPTALRCQACKALLNKWADAASYRPQRRPRLDLGTTYDGVLIASERFAECLARAEIQGLDLMPLTLGSYLVNPTIVVRFDCKSAGSLFDRQCAVCGHYESVVGTTPIALLPGEVVAENSIVRSDLEFGSNDEKCPVILCGDGAARELKRAKLKGLTLVRC
jgi:hypothetical protein